MSNKVSPSHCKKCEHQEYDYDDEGKEITFCSLYIAMANSYMCKPYSSWCALVPLIKRTNYTRTDDNTLT